MIHYLLHKQIDKKVWDNTISTSKHEKIYAYSWYLDVMCPNWEALVLNEYEAVMPLTGKKKMGIKYLFNPFFIQQLGVFSPKNIDAKQVKIFIDAIPKKFKFIEINLNEANDTSTLEQPIVINKNFVLDLNSDYKTLLNSYSENTKRNLRKSIAHPFEIVQNISSSEVISLFLNDRGKTIDSLKPKHYKQFQQLVEVAEKKIKVLKMGVKNDVGVLISGTIIFIHNKTLTFIFSGNSIEGKVKFAMFFLIDSIIQQFSNSFFEFDFEGSNNSGLAQFYKGFGANNKPYPSIKVSNLPLVFRLLKH